MNLWIFGDSFAEMQSSGQTGSEWQLQIVNHFISAIKPDTDA